MNPMGSFSLSFLSFPFLSFPFPSFSTELAFHFLPLYNSGEKNKRQKTKRPVPSLIVCVFVFFIISYSSSDESPSSPFQSCPQQKKKKKKKEKNPKQFSRCEKKKHRPIL
ncbi:hypothetical protein QBC44DRAFT_99486 [Cladorrhinum sp. PSN332]|nr:hypothetical protein QBC44DRAFT_99486 [Cladorrhinum sp. PSN332]